MRRTLALIAFFAICSAMMMSCKNNKKVQNQDSSQEEIQQQKQALADTVMAQIDALAEEYANASEKSFFFRGFELSDAEKMVKPDYLLDPSESDNMITKSQKINALAIYLVETGIRSIYDMPTEETKQAIAKLAAEVNHPVDTDIYNRDTPPSEVIRMEYQKCKEAGDEAYFWQLQYAIITESNYILAQNPELYFSKITDDQWKAFWTKVLSKLKAIEKLAEYDEEMADILEFRSKYRITASDESRDSSDRSIASAKKRHIDCKDKIIAKRNALLQ